MAQNNDNGSSTKRKIDEDLMEDAEAVNLAADWADISQGLRKDLGHQLHSQWIKPIQLGSVCKESGTLDLFLPTEFSANWVNDRFHERLQLAWKIVRSEVRKVRISVHPGRRQLPELMLNNGRRPANDADTSAIAVAAGTIGEGRCANPDGLRQQRHGGPVRRKRRHHGAAIQSAGRLDQSDRGRQRPLARNERPDAGA